MLSILVLVFIICCFLFFLGHFLPVRNAYSEKERPYECGFDPINSPRTPFSFRFFLVAILFLIFDLEIVLLIPLVSSFTYNVMVAFFWGVFFLSLLVLGLVYEWVNGGLDWAD
uniref:NADH-ubiquinone oxidoreductase chain 3 n=1 Tax=Chiridota sp. SS-2021 TaxID=2834204 RepID=A0A8E5NLB4_9ECHN|nr:NADH dehydrogenase subunit 3 [Chiridota sp. SS-2021]